MDDVTVAAVDPTETLTLRQQVLRPHQTVAEMSAESDAAGVIAVAARRDGRVVSCAIAHPAPCPDLPDRPHAWRLRGMATADPERGTGLGGRVLERLLEDARRGGARLVWCNARIPAQRFYERAGFTVIGEPWEEPVIGPHVRMWRPL